MDNKRQKLTVSVIVPIYNTGEKLRCLVDSILAQTFRDFELLLIDDGSTDVITPQICDEYGEKNSQVKVFHKKNGGVSDSRNFGLDHAQGMFIAFADHDDYMFPDNLQTMVEEIGDRDLLICDYNTGLRESIKDVKRKFKTWEVVANKKEEMPEAVTKIGYKNAPVWNQLFRQDIINNNKIKFQKIQYEDELFSFQYLIFVNSLKRIDYAGYYWIQTPKSLGSNHKYIAEMDWIRKMEGLYEKFINKYNLHGNQVDTYNWRIANRLAVLCVKGYYKDSHKTWQERMKIWNEVRKDKWLQAKIDISHVNNKMRIILTIAKYHLFYILEPLFIVYGKTHSI